MLRPAEIVRLTVGVHVAGREAMVAALHEAGVVELRSVSDEAELHTLVTPCPRSAAVPDLAEVRARLERAIEVLEVVTPQQNPVSKLFFPPKSEMVAFPITGAVSALDVAGGYADLIDRILALHARDGAAAERLAHLSEEEEVLRLLAPFGIVPVRLQEGGILEIHVGIIPAGECADIEAHLTKEMPALAAAYLLCGVGGQPATVVCFSHPDVAADVNRVLRLLAFREFRPETVSDTAAGGIAAIAEERMRLEEERTDIHTTLVRLTMDHLGVLAALSEELGVMRDREDAAPLFGETGPLVVLQGWAKTRDLPQIHHLCDHATGGLSFCSTAPATEGVPSAFNHPPWLAPYGFLTAMFGMPAYGRVDPTIFLAPVLVLTFGLMLGDAGYGILLLLIALLLLRGAGQTPGTVHDLAVVLCACGAAGTVFGLLMGSVFGNLPEIAGVTLPFVLLEPLTDPLTLLILALAIGIAHLNLGLGIAAEEHLRCRDHRAMFFSEGTWFLLQPCAAVLILSFFGWAAFSPIVTIIAGGGAAIAVAAILYDNGPLGFFSITGYLGDWLSYARILALALATGGIAMMINILAGMIAGAGTVFVIAGIAFAVVGHAANLVLQCLGGFIHALRLQYVEFFGRFFDAGGRPFVPFGAQRIRTRPQEGSDGR